MIYIVTLESRRKDKFETRQRGDGGSDDTRQQRRARLRRAAQVKGGRQWRQHYG